MRARLLVSCCVPKVWQQSRPNSLRLAVLMSRSKGPSAAMNDEEMQQQYRIQQSRVRCVGCGEGEEFF